MVQTYVKLMRITEDMRDVTSAPVFGLNDLMMIIGVFHSTTSVSAIPCFVKL